jgi:hypothetical protein
MKKQHALLMALFFILYFATFLPNFGIFNELKLVGFLPQSLAWVLLLNAINTVIIFIVYYKYFKPFAENVSREFNENKTEGGE